MLEGHEKTLLAAQGYRELGMLDDALAELDTLPAEVKRHSGVLELRLVVLMQTRRWEEALQASRILCEVEPEKTIGYIHVAFCLHELGNTVGARETLLGGPTALHTDPTYHYNLACYECRLGNLELAQAHLDRSFQLDKKFREFARTDPDLEPLRARS
jgi:predicted Zn-dependent protease